MYTRKPSVLISSVLLALALVACGTSEETGADFTPLAVTVELDLDFAMRGEVVDGKVFGDNTTGVRVSVGGIPADVEVTSGNTFRFPVPAESPAGPQTVVVELTSRTLTFPLQVLGDDIRPELSLLLDPDKTVDDVRSQLDEVEFEVVEGPSPLGGDSEPCLANRLKIRVADMSVGQALTQLHRNGGEGSIWRSDPLSGYSSGSVNHLGATGAKMSRNRGFDGTGTVIAVLDTGVSPHRELGSRLLLEQGYDFVEEGTPPLDEFAGGHGTPVAVLAAGSTSGVAPDAQVLPIRICDANGTCFSDDLVAAICYAVTKAEESQAGADDLILNVSMGGETPVSTVKAALEYAVARGALVASAGGNEGLDGSPAHYPAAFDLAGVVAVAPLRPTDSGNDWEPAPFGTNGSYLDIAAPGTELKSGSPDGAYGFAYSGTSYAAAQVAGALAAWREARPAMSPADIERALEAAARPLPYPATVVGAGMLDLSVQPD